LGISPAANAAQKQARRSVTEISFGTGRLASKVRPESTAGWSLGKRSYDGQYDNNTTALIHMPIVKE